LIHFALWIFAPFTLLVANALILPDNSKPGMILLNYLITAVAIFSYYCRKQASAALEGTKATFIAEPLRSKLRGIRWSGAGLRDLWRRLTGDEKIALAMWGLAIVIAVAAVAGVTGWLWYWKDKVMKYGFFW